MELNKGQFLTSLKKPIFSEEIRKILDSNEPYMIAYLLDNHSIYENFVEYLANKLNLKIVWLTGRDWTGPVTRNCAETDPSGFVHLFSNAKFACVDGFHGSCFALNFSVPFLLLTKENSIKNDSRMTDLYTRLGVSNRIVTDPASDFEKFDDLDFDLIQEKLSDERDSSKKYLYESLLSASSDSNHHNVAFYDEKKILSDDLNNFSLQSYDSNEFEERKLSLFIDKRLSIKLVKYSVYDSVSKGICTGCGSCINICPRKALVFSVDRYGSYVPTIDISKCDNCGLCKRICPALNIQKRKNDSKPKLFAFIAKNHELLKISSSGGACGVLSELVIKDGGVVCGCSWNSVKQRAEHIIVDNLDDVLKFHKSKYIQSYMGDVLLKIKSYLKSDKKVLFIGCPCQVAGLKSFLKSDYDNLITIDLLCGNSPSKRFFLEYLAERFGELPVSCDFRDKSKGKWNSYTSRITMYDDSYTFIEMNNNSYMKAYHRHFLCPIHCEKCIYQSIPRFGDLSIGDFWGIDDKDVSIDTNLGVSAILVNNEKGRDLLNNIPQEVVAYLQEKPIEWLGGNGFALEGSNNWASVGRDVFYNNFLQYGFKKSFDLAMSAQKGEINTCFQGKKILHLKMQEVKFNYNTSAWESHLIRGISYMFPLTNTKGNFATISLEDVTQKDKFYLFNIKFKIVSDANSVSFWIFDSKIKKMKRIYEYQQNQNDRKQTVALCSKFYSDWNYDSFMIGTSQITGKNAYISISEVFVAECIDYLNN